MIFRFLVFFLFTSAALQAVASDIYRRSVGFDWESVEDSKGYDIEITQAQTGKVFTFKLKDPSWSGKLPPGSFSFRVRSRDHRNVPGDWSTPNPFSVGLENVRIKFPAPQAQLKSKETAKEEIKFQWQTVPGANFYRFQLLTEDGKSIENKDLKGTDYEVTLPVAAKYRWSVQGFASESLKSDTVSSAEFTLVGPALAAPEIQKPENEFVREVSWKKPVNAENYDYALTHFNSETKKWEKVNGAADFTDSKINFESQWPGGPWRLAVRAKSKNRISSPVSVLNFNVQNGDRSPASEYVATVRKSIDRIDGWFGTATYLISLLNYQSLVNFDSTIGGTGKLGLGWLKENNKWGFLSTLEMSGFLADSKNYTYTGFEASAIYRSKMRETDELRLLSGITMKELPVLLLPADALTRFQTGQATSASKASALGPHLGIEYWRSLTPKLGVQLNGKLTYSMLKMSLPENGTALSPTLSMQYGVLGSYRKSQNLTGLMGITYREDKLAYKDSFAEKNFTNGFGNPVEITVKGIYLSFFAEYSF